MCHKANAHWRLVRAAGSKHLKLVSAMLCSCVTDTYRLFCLQFLVEEIHHLMTHVGVGRRCVYQYGGQRAPSTGPIPVPTGPIPSGAIASSKRSQLDCLPRCFICSQLHLGAMFLLQVVCTQTGGIGEGAALHTPRTQPRASRAWQQAPQGHLCTPIGPHHFLRTHPEATFILPHMRV